MLEKYSKKLEILANVLLLIVGTIIIAIFIYKFTFSNKTNTNKNEKLQIGALINLKEKVLEFHQRNLLIFLQKDCRFCSESAPFYKKIEEITIGSNNLGVLIFTPHKIEVSEEYIKELGLQFNEIRKINLNQIGIRGTPTIILTNNSGQILNIWEGRLSPSDEKMVLQQISCFREEKCF